MNLKTLRELATKATTTSGVVVEDVGREIFRLDGPLTDCEGCVSPGVDFCHADDAYYYAAVNSQNILKLLDVVEAAASLMSEDDAVESVSHFNALFILKNALEKLNE